MAFLRRKDRRQLIPLHRDNARSDDWLILLEANTIVGPARKALRVACATRERNIASCLAPAFSSHDGSHSRGGLQRELAKMEHLA